MKKIWVLLIMVLSFLVACTEHNITRSITEEKIVKTEDFVLEQISGNNYRIVDYIGTKTDIIIPAKIGDKNIVEIGDAKVCDGDALIGSFAEKGITSIELPDSIISIGDFAFAYNNITNIILPNSITSIGIFSFAGNQLVKLIIPDSVTSIGYAAFNENLIEEITLSNSLESLEDFVFSENNLTSITLPSLITKIEYGAFSSNNITKITIGSDVDISYTKNFENDFKTFYDTNGKKSGTYNYNGINWE